MRVCYCGADKHGLGYSENIVSRLSERERAMFVRIWVLVYLGCSMVSASWAQELQRGIAFTTREVVRRFDGKGQEVARDTVTFAVKGDGSTARHEKRVSLRTSEVYEFVDIDDAVSHASVRFDLATKSKTVLPGSTRRPKVALNTCEGATGNPETLFGYKVYRIRESWGDTGIKVERLVAPALGCTDLWLEVVGTNPDGSFATKNVHEVVGVIMGEPLQDLFQMRQEFVERTRSEVLAEYARLRAKK